MAENDAPAVQPVAAKPKVDPPTERERFEAESRHKERELDLREREADRARWTTPLIVAIAGAVIAAIGNILAILYTGTDQRQLERIRNDATTAIERSKAEAQIELEASKAEAQLILDVIKGLPDKRQASANLDFLVQTNLITRQKTREGIAAYVSKYPKAEGGVLLPALGSFGSVLPSGTQMKTQRLIARKQFCQITDISVESAIERLTGILSAPPLSARTTTPKANEDGILTTLSAAMTLEERTVVLDYSVSRMGKDVWILAKFGNETSKNVSNEQRLELLRRISVALLREGTECSFGDEEDVVQRN